MFEQAFAQLGPRPTNGTQAQKKAYGESLSAALARTIAGDLRARGLTGCMPDTAGGAERTFAGGIGAKKVDVSWATEEAGLMLALSVKTINFADARTGNYQKNLTNRRGDMLFEAVTLHRRFPFAVLGGVFMLHEGAEHDATDQRESTFGNAHERFKLFSGRGDPAGREEQFERIVIGLYASESPFRLRLYFAGRPHVIVQWSDMCADLLEAVAARNPNHLAHRDGQLHRRP